LADRAAATNDRFGPIRSGGKQIVDPLARKTIQPTLDARVPEFQAGPCSLKSRRFV
jgi:hypothetical protein